MWLLPSLGGDGALKWQMAHMTGGGFLPRESVCPHVLLTLLTPSQEDLRPRLGPTPSAPVSVARKVLCQSGSPGIGQQQATGNGAGGEKEGW